MAPQPTHFHALDDNVISARQPSPNTLAFIAKLLKRAFSND